jgi:uncharacterized OB-fold protein
MTYGKPLPAPDHDSLPFWEGCRSHRLLVQRCEDCGRPRFPPGPRCPHCRSPRARWDESRGRGTVYSWIVVEHPVPPDVYGADVPYVVALVDLDEGVRMATNIVGCDPYGVTAGMVVQVRFDDVADGISLPRFAPVAAS